MKIHRFCCYVFVNSVLFQSLLSKPISLNDIIAAEKNSKSSQLVQRKPSETNVQDYSNKHKSSSATLARITAGSTILPIKNLSPLKYKKTFQIRTPLRPKKIKYSHKPRSRLINTTKKREIHHNDKFNRSYIPLLKSLSVLFNNILGPDSWEDGDTGHNYNRHQPISSEECACANKSKYKIREPDQAEEATASSSSITAKISSEAKTIIPPEAPSSPPHNTFNDNIGSLRRNTNLSILSTRNTASSRRNHNEFSKGSIATHYRNFERHIAGNNGSDESNNSRGTEAGPYTEDNKGNSDSISGDNASCYGSCRPIGGNRNITENTEYETTTIETDIIRSHETTESYRGDGYQFKGFDKFQTRSNKTESRTLLSQSNSRLRGYTSQKETTEISWQIQGPEKSAFNVTYNITSNQRISDRDSSLAAKDKEFRRTDKTITLTDNNVHKSFINAPPSNSSHDEQKIVMIYDGYSIARDVNGDNKLTEKVYRIHS